MNSKYQLSFKRKEYLSNSIIVEGKNLTHLKKSFITKNSEYGSEAYENIYLWNISNVSSCILSSENKLKKILMFGDVQSGKTNNIIFLISYLIDLGFKKFILLTGTKNVLNSQNLQRIEEYYDKNLFKPFFNKENFFKKDNSIEFLYGIKQNISNVITNIDDTNYEVINNLDLVIIDDEGDEASAEKNKKEPKINSCISEILKSNFKKILYISITATPYANIITYTDDLKPDFVIPLVSSKNYTGGNVFKDKEKYIVIPDNICNLFNENKSNDELISFIEDCIMQFILQCFRDNIPYQFLVNVHIPNKKIRTLANIFKNILSLLRAKKNMILKYIKEDEYINFLTFSNKVKVKEIHEKELYEREEVPEIIIGGLLLSRGVTFDKLLYEIMLNAPKNVFKSDTLLQRARWYGYRGKYIDKMKIFVSQRIKNFYTGITTVEQEIKKLYIDNKFDNRTKKAVPMLNEIFKKYEGGWNNG